MFVMVWPEMRWPEKNYHHQRRVTLKFYSRSTYLPVYHFIYRFYYCYHFSGFSTKLCEPTHPHLRTVLRIRTAGKLQSRSKSSSYHNLLISGRWSFILLMRATFWFKVWNENSLSRFSSRFSLLIHLPQLKTCKTMDKKYRNVRWWCLSRMISHIWSSTIFSFSTPLINYCQVSVIRFTWLSAERSFLATTKKIQKLFDFIRWLMGENKHKTTRSEPNPRKFAAMYLPLLLDRHWLLPLFYSFCWHA